MSQALVQMDAIAHGVEIRQDLLTGYSKSVLYETMRIAEQLGVPDKTIQKFKTSRLAQDSERLQEVLSTLKTLQRNS